MLTIEELLKQALETARPLAPIELALRDAAGCVLAGVAVKPSDSPFDSDAQVLPSGTLLREREIAALAAAGCVRVLVHPQPRAVVVTAQDALVEVGQQVGPDQQPDIASVMLTTAASQTGALAFRGGPISADPTTIGHSIQDQLVRADLVVLALNLADIDELSPELLAALEAADCRDIKLSAIEPGGLIGSAVVGEDAIPLVLLDVNVLGAFIGFEVLVRPLLMSLAGRQSQFRPVVRSVVDMAAASQPGVRGFLPAVTSVNSDGKLAVAVLDRPSDEAASWLYEVNALMIVPEDKAKAGAGEQIAVIRLDRE